MTTTLKMMQNTLALGNCGNPNSIRPPLNYSFSYESEVKILDEFLRENPMLDTPDINLDQFEFDMKSNNTFQLNEADWFNNNTAVAAATAAGGPGQLSDNQAYSPKSQLESKEINLEYMSSPEMAPVSPNTVCPQVQYDSTTTTTSMYMPNSIDSNVATTGYTNLTTNLDDQSFLTDYINTNAIQSSSNDPMITGMSTVIGHSQPFSPQSVSSNYSVESSEKTFANLDNVQSHSQYNPSIVANIKQEPDLYQPTVIEEFLYGDSAGYTSAQPILYSGHHQTHSQQQQQSMQVPQSVPINPHSYSTNAPTSSSTTNPITEQNSQYYYNLQPGTSTVQIKQQPQSRCSPVPQLQQLSQQQPSPVPSVAPGSRKRTASCASTSTNASGCTTVTTGPSTSGTSSAKKPRMTKREKQLMMDRQIEEFTKDQKQLNEQIITLTKQIEFCKRYLSDNVKPVIQQQQMHHQQQQQPTTQFHNY